MTTLETNTITISATARFLTIFPTSQKVQLYLPTLIINSVKSNLVKSNTSFLHHQPQVASPPVQIQEFLPLSSRS